MAEAIYKVGDVLEFINPYGLQINSNHISGSRRALIIRVDESGFDYTAYGLLIYDKEHGNFINYHASIVQKDLFREAKRIGHIDISLLRFEKQESPSPGFISAFSGGWILAMMNQKNGDCTDSEKFHKLMDIMKQVGELQDQTEKIRNLEEENAKLKKENEKLKADAEEKSCPFQKLSVAMGQRQVPTPEEFRDKMRVIHAQYIDDEEMFHVIADQYICDIMADLGFEEGIQIFKAADKWYA